MSVLTRPRQSSELATGRLRDVAVNREQANALCRFSTRMLISARGEIIVLHVDGEIDLWTLPALQAALARSLRRRPRYLVVDLSRMTYCGAAGLWQLERAGAEAAENGIGYAVSGCAPHLSRLWSRVWPATEVPVRYRTVAAAVTAIVLGQQLGSRR